jgi:hypothetical protein
MVRSPRPRAHRSQAEEPAPMRRVVALIAALVVLAGGTTSGFLESTPQAEPGLGKLWPDDGVAHDASLRQLRDTVLAVARRRDLSMLMAMSADSLSIAGELMTRDQFVAWFERKAAPDQASARRIRRRVQLAAHQDATRAGGMGAVEVRVEQLRPSIPVSESGPSLEMGRLHYRRLSSHIPAAKLAPDVHGSTLPISHRCGRNLAAAG